MLKAKRQEFYTTGEIAKITGISRATIVKYCRDGVIPCQVTPITNYRRVPISDFTAFLKKNGVEIKFS